MKSETSDSFVSHFDGHFAYLKTLDFYFNLFKPVLNWANCLFAEQFAELKKKILIELLVLWTWFGQFDKLCFVHGL